MTQDEQFFRLMRRWLAVEKCLETLTDTEREIAYALFRRSEDLKETAKRLGMTRPCVRLIRHRVCRILSDMLCGGLEDEPKPPQ